MTNVITHNYSLYMLLVHDIWRYTYVELNVSDAFQRQELAQLL
jgi:hypothetical protein